MVDHLPKLKRVPLSTLRTVLRACATHVGASTDAVARSCGISGSTGTKALAVLAEFGLIHGNPSGWVCASTAISRASDDAAVDGAFHEALLAYRPFESICEGLIAGEAFEQAARHTAVAFGLDARGEAKLDLLRLWGLELGVLTDGDPVTLSRDPRELVEALSAVPVCGLVSLADTRLYISTTLGRDAFDELDEVDRGLLATAVTECDSNAPSSVEASGQALEDRLRELCTDRGLGAEARKLNGAGQLAGLLRQHGIIHPHHVKLVDSVAMLRNAKAHKKDKQTVAPWNITPLAARTAFGATALALRSIHDWVTRGRQSL